MPKFAWLSERSSGLPDLDQLCHELSLSLRRLSATPDPAFLESYQALVAQIERLFRQEELWMEEIDWPVFREHQEMNARVLRGLHQAHRQMMQGDLRAGREIVEHLLPEWLAFHLSTMVAALVMAMQVNETETSGARPAGPLSPMPHMAY